MASTKRSGRQVRTKKKYVPSAEQRAEDTRIKEKLDHLSEDDLREFDQALKNAVKSQAADKTESSG